MTDYEKDAEAEMVCDAWDRYREAGGKVEIKEFAAIYRQWAEERARYERQIDALQDAVLRIAEMAEEALRFACGTVINLNGRTEHAAQLTGLLTRMQAARKAFAKAQMPSKTA